jgi:hypothetical protein
MAEIQENIINRSKIKDSINPNDLPNLSFSIPTDPNTISKIILSANKGVSIMLKLVNRVFNIK